MGNTFGAEVMEKLATRAWKKHWGDLSQNAQSQLVRRNILNRAKELEGLEKGTANILKKTNSTITDNPKKVRRHVFVHAGGGMLRRISQASTMGKHIKNGNLATTYTPNKIDRKGLRRDATKYLKDIHSGDKLKDKLRDSVFANQLAVNKHERIKPNARQIIFLANKDALAKDQNSSLGYKKKSAKAIKSDFDKRYHHALAARHEAYETVAALKKARTGDLAEKSSLSSHHSSYVPMMESKDVAIAPRKVKDSLIDLRKRYTGELDTENKYMNGFEYAKSAVPEKKLARGVDKTTRKNFDKTNSEESVLGRIIRYNARFAKK